MVELHSALQKADTNYWSRDTDRAVAQAVQKTHPELALKIWKITVNQLIATVQVRSYKEAIPYLKLMRKVYTANNQLHQWRSLLLGLRTAHKAKRRLMEMLDAL